MKFSEKSYRYPQGSRERYRLFWQLQEKCNRGEFDEEFFELLTAYQQLDSESEFVDILIARCAISVRDFALARQMAERAARKRPGNFEVWKLLEQCYLEAGQPVRALFYAGCSANFYGKPVNIKLASAEVETGMQQLSKALGIGHYAPFYAAVAEMVNGEMKTHRAVMAGEFITGNNNDDSMPYFVGVYNEQEQLEAKGLLAEREKEIPQFVLDAGAGFVFDIMRGRAVTEYSYDGKAPVILPIAGTEAKQSVQFKINGEKTEAVAGKWAYSFYRLDEKVKITSDKKLVIGNPVRLGHAAGRKKLVINILVDALSWAEIKKQNYRQIPDIMKFFSKGIIFDNNYSVSEYTFPSFTGIESGAYPHNTGIFNERLYHELPAEFVTISERMRDKGYYCVNVMGGGDGIYTGGTRGYERLIVNPYTTVMYSGVEKAIRQIEAFSECDQFLLLHVMDTHPWSVREYTIPLNAQTKLSLRERLSGEKERRNSVYLPSTPVYQEGNLAGIRNVNRSLKNLFDYLTANYSDDEYVVMLYSDHGVPIYDEAPDVLSDGQTGAALMLRGSGIPQKGLVTDELTSTMDIYHILGKVLDFPAEGNTDGNLPAALGGKKRDHVISYSMYPGQTYKLCIRSSEYGFYLESLQPTDEDGTVDLGKAKCRIFRLADPAVDVYDDKLKEYFFGLVDFYTRSFNNDGRYWTEMRKARADWFK